MSLRRALCVCDSGAVRSVTLQRMLTKRGWQALAVGVDDHDKDTLRMLVDWADIVYVADASTYTTLVRKAFSAKAKVNLSFMVGPDDWKVPHHADLVRIYRKLFGDVVV